MKEKNVRNQTLRKWLFLAPFSLVVMLLIVWTVPTLVSSQSQDDLEKSIPQKQIGSFDIRDSNNESTRQSIVQNRKLLSESRKATVENLGRTMKQAQERFTKQKSNLDIKWSDETGAPEIVGVLTSEQKLTGRSKSGRDSTLRQFLSNNSNLYGLTTNQIAELKKTADYTNPAGNMSFVDFEQKIDGIPVFQGNVRGAFTKDGELIRTTGRLVPGLNYNELSQAKDSLSNNLKSEAAAQAVSAGSPADAVAAAAKTIGVEVNAADLVLKETSEDGNSFIFERGPFADDIKVDLVYFPLQSGVATLSWSMTLWQDQPAYYTLVDAQSGDLLWRKNITEEQTQSATYSVYDGDSPSPMTPFIGQPVVPAIAPGGFQPNAVPRTNFTLVSEHLSNNLGWITDDVTTTTGNNVDAGLDIVSPNGIDPGGRPVSTDRNFVYNYNPSPGIPGALGSSDPSDVNYRWGAVTNLFFWTNRYRDRLYEVGFTEAARNFQQDNFGRNPAGATVAARNGLDRVLAEAQDFGGTNNANFATPPDGQSGRMQMYRWPNSNRDGDLDNEIVLHELTHGTSNRLHNNASGLGSVLSRGMGEGWSDFYARAILSTPDEDVDGIYTTGGYATHLATANYTNNYYYGIRRFPYAVKANVGSNGKPHNPLTLADIDPNTIDLTDGAFARGPFGSGGRAGAIAVHNIGELWSMALLEVRARVVKRMGYEAGNQRMLQLVTDAMKLDPVNPTLIDGRNSLLAAAVAFGGVDAPDIWAGFATRGMGYGASIVTAQRQNVVESFDNPIPGMGAVTFTDCNNNGVANPGETITLSIPLINPLKSDVNSVTATIGNQTANYGTISPNQTVTQQISYQVPSAALIGSTISIDIVVNSNLGQQTKSFKVTVGGDPNNITFRENFDGVTAPALPNGWSALVNPNTSPVWRTVNTSNQTAPNAAFVNFVSTTSLSFLQSPAIPVTSPNTILSFRHSYNSEYEWDGGVLQISLDGGTTYLDILDSGEGARFIEGGYNYVLKNSTADGNTNLLQNRAAWTGNSSGFITTKVQLPVSAAGKSIRLRWIAGADSAFTVTNPGWTIDNVSLAEGYQTSSVTTVTTVDTVSGQYSDQVILNAAVSAGCINPAGTIEFKVGNVTVAALPVNGNGTYSTPYTITNAPGSHTITANFVSSNPYYQNSNGSNTLTVNREDASVAFPNTNQYSVKVNTAGGTAGPITICADITEVADGSAGNLSNPTTTASFSFSPVAGGSAPTPGVVTYSGGGIGGTLRACTIVSNVRVDVYDVAVTVNGYYTGTGSTVLAVYDPSLGFVTGGGTIINNGNVANFGINIKYIRNGKPQGSLLYIERRPNGEAKIKSNALDSMSIVNNTAIILTKATVNGMGSHNIRMTVVDNGEPGSSDQLGLQTTNPSNVGMPDLTFGLTTLRGGNIQVPLPR